MAAVETLVAQIEQNSAGRVQAYTERLYTRLKELLEDRNIDDARIVTEAAIFADKTAIDEETVRLHSHVAQYRSIMKLINIGFGNMVNADRVIAVVSPDSAPIKRIVQDARDKGAAIDATYGRRTRAVIITDSDHVVLSAFEPEEVLGRFEKEQDKPTV